MANAAAGASACVANALAGVQGTQDDESSHNRGLEPARPQNRLHASHPIGGLGFPLGFWKEAEVFVQRRRGAFPRSCPARHRGSLRHRDSRPFLAGGASRITRASCDGRASCFGKATELPIHSSLPVEFSLSTGRQIASKVRLQLLSKHQFGVPLHDHFYSFGCNGLEIACPFADCPR